MKTIDLSHIIHPNMSIYPDTEKPKIHKIANLKDNCYTETQITLTSHTGTHIDAPFHMIDTGKVLTDLEIGIFIGRAFVIDIERINSELIHLEDLLGYEEVICKVDFLLFNTGWSRYWERDEYFTGYPVLSNESASWLNKFNLKGIGIDTISVDSPADTTYSNHHILLKNGILIIENLTNLSAIDSDLFTFCCLPLKFEEADGSPTRAIAIINEETP